MPGRALHRLATALRRAAGNSNIRWHDREHPGHRLRPHLHAQEKINISTVLAGQKPGIREVDDGIWLVSFMPYDLGYIEPEQRTLQTIDNPFGTRLSPMS